MTLHRPPLQSPLPLPRPSLPLFVVGVVAIIAAINASQLARDPPQTYGNNNSERRTAAVGNGRQTQSQHSPAPAWPCAMAFSLFSIAWTSRLRFFMANIYLPLPSISRCQMYYLHADEGKTHAQKSTGRKSKHGHVASWALIKKKIHPLPLTGPCAHELPICR